MSRPGSVRFGIDFLHILGHEGRQRCVGPIGVRLVLVTVRLDGARECLPECVSTGGTCSPAAREIGSILWPGRMPMPSDNSITAAGRLRSQDQSSWVIQCRPEVAEIACRRGANDSDAGVYVHP